MQPPDSPAWLVAYHAERGSSVPTPGTYTPPPVVIKAPPPPPPPPKPRPPNPPQNYRKDVLQGIVEPKRWEYDGVKQREAVVDKDTGRVIRRVGWRHCLRCKKPFFSGDIAGLRLCDSSWDGCRENDDKFA